MKFVPALVAVLAAGGALLGARGTQEPAAPVVEKPAAPIEKPAVPADKPAAPAGYVWAAACKDCHTDIYASWETTKHAKAINRLNKDEQQQECIGCHVTGAKALLEEGGKPINAGVQCEGCHGPGAAHAAAPTTAKMGKVQESRCTACHSDRSPHFKGFYFKGMAELSHAMVKK